MARKILLADDSVTAQNMGRKILADAGYEVIAVNNGSAALKKIADLQPELVILDVYMPGYGGLEVCQRLKESPETAPIPVLLTVGKLEPFKPDEAHRVRAEGFIVKPFEASELLSALSKLEDKIVPRSEPSKGRASRTKEAAETSERADRSETAERKSRIELPAEKTEPEEAEDGRDIYNPMNRDLRTVVETAAEKKANRQREGSWQQRENAAIPEAEVVPAPTAAPEDAISQVVASVPTADIKATEAALAAVSTFTADSNADAPICGSEKTASAEVSETKIEPPAANEQITEAKSVEVPTAERATLGAEIVEKPDQRSTESRQDEPATIAAAAESVPATDAGAPRWTAVPVALEGDEATKSLEDEMQRAFAEGSSSGQSKPAETQAAPADKPVVLTMETIMETPAAADAAPKLDSAALDSIAAQRSVIPDSASASSEPEPAALSASNSMVEAAQDSALAAEAKLETPAVEFAQQEPAPTDQFVSFVNTEDAHAEAIAEAVPQSEPEPATHAGITEPALAEAAAASSGGYVAFVQNAQPGPAAEVKAETPETSTTESGLDTEVVKSAAAAWATWRQIRDTSKSEEGARAESAEAPPGESRDLETASAANAMSAAAGAEQTAAEAASTPANGSGSDANSDSSDIAGIVDSVLADLRPKLMQEIARKMGKKKK